MSGTVQPPTVAPQAELRQQIDAALRDRLPQLLSPIARKINVAQVLAASGTVADLEIDKVIIGTVLIGRLSLQNTNFDVHSASAHLRNVRMILQLNFSFDWWYDIGLWSDSGTDDLGSLSFAMTVGDVEVPSLHDIALKIPALSAEAISAVVPPINNLDLGGAAFTGLQATNTTIPGDGFQLSGLGLGAVSISSLQVPRTTVEKLSVQQFKPNGNVTLPGLQLNQLQIPSASAENIQTPAGFGFDAIAGKSGLPIDLGVFGGTISVTPIVHIDIGSMRLQDLSIAATIGQVNLQELHLPVDVRGINLKSIDIGQLDVNNVTL